MKKTELRQINQRLARLEQRIERIDDNPAGPSTAVPLDLLPHDSQMQALEDGQVLDGKVWG